MDGWTDGRTDGRTDGQTESSPLGKILQGITISLGPAKISGVVCNRENFVCVNKSAKEGKDQESIQSSTTPDQDTNGKVTNSQLDITNERQEVSPFPAGDHNAN